MPSHNAHAKLEFSGSKSHIAHLAGATRQRKAGFRTGMWTKTACRLLCWWACVYVATADKRACCAACNLRLATCESELGSGMVPNASRTPHPPPPPPPPHTHTHCHWQHPTARARARVCVCVWVCVWSQNLFNFIHRRYCYYGRTAAIAITVAWYFYSPANLVSVNKSLNSNSNSPIGADE